MVSLKPELRRSVEEKWKCIKDSEGGVDFGWCLGKDVGNRQRLRLRNEAANNGDMRPLLVSGRGLKCTFSDF